MQKIRWVVGVDEAGRGPLAGPVSVGAVAMPEHLYREHTRFIGGIRDSKKLTERAREEWFKKLKDLERAGKIRTGVSLVGNTVIDTKGIMFAIRRGVRRTLNKLNIDPRSARVLLDGSLFAPAEWGNQQTIIRGDDRVALIAAASILAKVRRDRYLVRLSLCYPQYHFEEHKGYGSALHRKAIRRHGLCPIHRKSFCHSLLKTGS